MGVANPLPPAPATAIESGVKGGWLDRHFATTQGLTRPAVTCAVDREGLGAVRGAAR